MTLPNELKERVESLCAGLRPELQVNPFASSCTDEQRDAIPPAIQEDLETIMSAIASCDYSPEIYQTLRKRLDEITRQALAVDIWYMKRSLALRTAANPTESINISEAREQHQRLLTGLAAAQHEKEAYDFRGGLLWNQAYALYEEANTPSTSDPAPTPA